MPGILRRTGLTFISMADQATTYGHVLVTGGARGIGEAIVRQVAQSGYDVTFTFSQSEEEAQTLKGELTGLYQQQSFTAHQLDLANREDVTAFAKDLAERDALYGFVHNAGMSYDTLTAMIDQSRAEKVMQVNFWAMTRLASALVRPMMAARRGRIIGIGSIAFVHASAGNAVYAASKGAMMSYIKTLAIEAARRGVCANYIAPGFVDTDMMAPYEDYRKKMESQIPLRRFAKPEEIAGLVDFLLSPPAAYITGTVIPIDGGIHAGLAVQR
jgi:3-oxoacyl-[acyl-carrier protein] reductase